MSPLESTLRPGLLHFRGLLPLAQHLHVVDADGLVGGVKGRFQFDVMSVVLLLLVPNWTAGYPQHGPAAN